MFYTLNIIMRSGAPAQQQWPAAVIERQGGCGQRSRASPRLLCVFRRRLNGQCVCVLFFFLHNGFVFVYEGSIL